ncbi:LOW QUALITY PROTEIN: hypothetical protein V2J09_000374 [Rumex salicifolius]
MGIEEVNLSLPSVVKEFVALKDRAQLSFHVTDNGRTSFPSSSKGFKAVLESLYLWFIYSKELNSRETFERVNLEDVICISKILFEELSKRLQVPLDSSSANLSRGGEILQSESDAVEEETIMLLRCCIASLNFLQNDQSVLLGRCEFLRRILCMLCSCQKNDSSEGCQTSSPLKPDVHFVCRILEVFMDELTTNKALKKYIKFLDELITNKALRKYIQISAFSSPARENMCSCLDFGYVLSAHFLQSYSGAQAFRGSIENLIWSCKENRAIPEVSLTAAISLLINPALASPPAFLHAHLISLISDAIGRGAVYDRTGFNLRFISCHMPAFEKSVSLYRRQLSKLVQNLFSENDDSVIKSAIRGVGFERPFESYLCPTLNGKLNSLIKNIDCSSCMMISQTSSNMVAILQNYVKENLHLLDESCRRTVSLFLSFLVEKAISADESKDALLHINGSVCPEDICLLASILKLMSCSLLQTVLYMSSIRNSVHHKTSSAGSFPVREYELLACVIDSFGQYRIQLPVQKLLHNKLEAQFSTVNGTKMMFVHFTGFLSICLAGGIEILAKGCLYLMLNVINLLFLEEGSLNFLNQLVSSGMESLFAQHPPANMSVFSTTTVGVDSSGDMQEEHTNKRSSVILASKFKKVKMSCERIGSAPGSQDEEAGSISGEEEACNGVAFLKCLSKNSGASDPCLEEELVSFIKCKEGKDYSAWLKNRARYRTRKLQKAEDQAWEMKKTTWRRSARLSSQMEFEQGYLFGNKSCQMSILAQKSAPTKIHDNDRMSASSISVDTHCCIKEMAYSMKAESHGRVMRPSPANPNSSSAILRSSLTT